MHPDEGGTEVTDWIRRLGEARTWDGACGMTGAAFVHGRIVSASARTGEQTGKYDGATSHNYH